MANLNRFPSLEFAMADAVTRLGVEAVRGVLGLSKSAVHKGCNANDTEHGFPRLTIAQVETLIRMLNEGGHPEFFSLHLMDLSGSKTPAEPVSDLDREVVAVTASVGGVATKLIEFTDPDSEMGIHLGPNEAAHLLARIRANKERLERMEAAVLSNTKQYGGVA